MEQFGSSVPAPQQNLEPSRGLAISPRAFPTIVTPYFPTKGRSSALFSALCSSILPACFRKKILKYAGMPMQLLGTVLGVIHVALGLQIVIAGLRGLASTFSR
jgi:small neutral amino acid transporter SnatA (MarC family)